MTRSSLKKHDSAVESRALKARRDRVTTQVRKDKRRQAVQTKRRRLMSTDDTQLTGRDISELVAILADASSASVDAHQERFNVLREIRVLLSTHEHDYDVIEKIIESGIVPIMVNLLNSASPLASATRTGGEVYREILWCLTNIASGQYEHTKLVLPAVPRLLQFIEGANNTLAEHAAWVLGNIAADCEEFRQQLIANGAVVPLIKQLAASSSSSENRELAKNCAWALSNIARGHETSAQAFVDGGIIPVVTVGLTQGSPQSFTEETVVEVAWLLSFLTAREELYLKAFLDSHLVDLLLPYFATSNELLLTPILRVFGNICCGSFDHHTDEWQLPYVHALLGNGSDSPFLAKLREFLQPDVAASHAHLASESAWVLSNLAALDSDVVQVLLQAGFLPLLGRQFKDGSFEVRREVAFALTNIALTSAAHLDQVLALNGDDSILTGFLQYLNAADVALVGNSLRFIENVLRVAPRGVHVIEVHEGIDALESVQFQSGEEHLSQWAAALVNEFYGENYGVNSPVNTGAAGGFVPSLSVLQPPPSGGVQFNLDQAAPGGRGRGAHMTTPAWKK
uniref:Importin subunit alpha n=1 Tax=Globisporangium ultimum (strain ATCC 200006 / CBS 805.95 / DAOM BR144) TaxID=431595 RepID=K3XB19_GLOUD